jgi:hypothetical protein
MYSINYLSVKLNIFIVMGFGREVVMSRVFMSISCTLQLKTCNWIMCVLFAFPLERVRIPHNEKFFLCLIPHHNLKAVLRTLVEWERFASV